MSENFWRSSKGLTGNFSPAGNVSPAETVRYGRLQAFIFVANSVFITRDLPNYSGRDFLLLDLFRASSCPGKIDIDELRRNGEEF